jgi:hypothetical protein
MYRHEERFFAACSHNESALFATFSAASFLEQEVMFLRWSDVNFELRTVRLTSKPEVGFYPKRWEDREIPAGGTHRRASEEYDTARIANLCSRRYREPRTAHSRSLQVYREAHKTRPDKI